MISTCAYGAPKKPEPAPAVEQAAPEKKGMFGRVKSALSFKKKEVPPVVEPVPAASAKPLAKVKPEVKGKSAPAVKAKPGSKPVETKPVAVEESAPPAKKGFFKKMFNKSPGDATVEPKLAKAKTVRPAPVKEVKPAPIKKKAA